MGFTKQRTSKNVARARGLINDHWCWLFFSVPVHRHWQTKALLPHRMVVHTLVCRPRTVFASSQTIYFLKDSESGFRHFVARYRAGVLSSQKIAAKWQNILVWVIKHPSKSRKNMSSNEPFFGSSAFANSTGEPSATQVTG